MLTSLFVLASMSTIKIGLSLLITMMLLVHVTISQLNSILIAIHMKLSFYFNPKVGLLFNVKIEIIKAGMAKRISKWGVT